MEYLQGFHTVYQLETWKLWRKQFPSYDWDGKVGYFSNGNVALNVISKINPKYKYQVIINPIGEWYSS